MTDYEKKYKEALERAKELYDNENASDARIAILENVFPEIAESEDERTRKELIAFIKKQEGQTLPNNGETWIAWLELQGEQKPADFSDLRTWKYIVDAVLTEKEGIGQYLDSPFTEEIAKKLQKRFGNIEQKPADKVEPKFHEGEWVLLTAGELSTTLQIVKVDTNKKLYWFNDSSYLPIVDEECLHIWTIQDAKDGDVLACPVNGNCSEKIIFILRRLIDADVECYCCIDACGDFDSCIKTSNIIGEIKDNDYTPATKEQRDTLMKAMADAGYTFDFESKELKKIEQKPTKWSLPYGKNETAEKLIALAECLEADGDCLFNGLSGDDYGKFLRELAKELTQPKQEWSEEDRGNLFDVKCIIEEVWHNQYVREEIDHSGEELESLWHWLNNLWQRVEYLHSHWRPSDEQMNALRQVISGCSYDIEPLAEIEEHLKKLMEE